MNIEWMVTYTTHFGDGRFGDDNNVFFDTRKEALEFIQERLPLKNDRDYGTHYLYLVIEDDIVEEMYEDYNLSISRKTMNSAVKHANIPKFWNKRWEYVGDLFDVDFWRWGK